MNDAATNRTTTHVRRLIAGMLLSSAMLTGAAGALAQDASPPAAGTPDPARISAVCDGVAERQAATPVAGQPAPESLEDVPADLLALDTLISHTEAIIALASVTEAGGTTSELVQYAGDARAAAQGQLDQLLAWRDNWYPGAPETPAAFQSALLDRSLAAAGALAGSGEAMPADGASRATALCDFAQHSEIPFDVAALDLTLAELQDGVAIALFVSQESDQSDLAAFATTASDEATADIGTLATWRDQWFGAAVPVVTPEPAGHEH
ncbi:MAG TPA: DUF305 domain-containing protein [Thermomicrobiales bacterium]|jgi:uncharacterized protein (DUF305 family)|nr:DUF305 domain-containing protein [Thermomicrobiales bacterium]